MQIYVARQPIYDCERCCLGYELLYLNHQENIHTIKPDKSHSTIAVLTQAVANFDWSDLTSGNNPFVNFTKELLLDKQPLLISPNHFVVEILEESNPDDPLLKMLELYRKRGYLLAIDDYSQEASQEELLEYADIIKVDFTLVTGNDRGRVAEQLLNLGKTLLAKKVETEQDFIDAANYGYMLLQGNYFAKPQMLCKTAIEISSDVSFLVLSELRTAVPDFEKLENIIKRDVKLTYQMLRWVNSAELHRGEEITSVKQALLRLGTEELRRRFSLLWMKGSISNGNDELCKIAFTRGLVCEELLLHSTHSKTEANDGFLVGMFSIIDLMVSDTMESVLSELAVSEQVKLALMGYDCRCYEALTAVRAYEVGDWEGVEEMLAKLSIATKNLTDSYLRAVEKSDGLI